MSAKTRTFCHNHAVNGANLVLQGPKACGNFVYMPGVDQRRRWAGVCASISHPSATSLPRLYVLGTCRLVRCAPCVARPRSVRRRFRCNKVLRLHPRVLANYGDAVHARCTPPVGATVVEAVGTVFYCVLACAFAQRYNSCVMDCRHARQQRRPPKLHIYWVDR